MLRKLARMVAVGAMATTLLAGTASLASAEARSTEFASETVSSLPVAAEAGRYASGWPKPTKLCQAFIDAANALEAAAEALDDAAGNASGSDKNMFEDLANLAYQESDRMVSEGNRLGCSIIEVID